MRRPARSSRTRAIALASALGGPLLACAIPAVSQDRSARGPWLQYRTPEEAGWSGSALEDAREQAEAMGSAAVMVVYRGRVVVAWGEVTRKLETYSVRKSLLNSLYGIQADRGVIDVSTTLGELGVEDHGPLTDSEKSARIEDLLRSRSGVYLPAAYATPEQEEARPPRDSYPPGKAFFYNNWDFNTLGTILVDLTGEDLFVGFQRHIAEPIGMEDYSPDDGFYVLEPSRSEHPAYTFRMSARDLARYGQLFLQRGEWDGQQILSEAWIEASWSSDVELSSGRGYGYLWHIASPGVFPDDSPMASLDAHDRYIALGTGGQMLMVIPDLDLVLVHRGDTDHDRRALDPERSRTIRDVDILRLFARILDARTGDPTPDPELMSLSPEPLAGLLPPVPPRVRRSVGAEEVDDYVGRYRYGRGREVRVYAYEGTRLFLADPGLGETEVFRLEGDTFFTPTAALLTIEFQRDDGGAVIGLRAVEEGTVLTADRVGA